MGIAAEIAFYLGEADEYFYSNYRATYYYNPGYFFAADSWKRIGEPTEKTNKIWWVSPREALEKLKRGSHRWAVERWVEKIKIKTERKRVDQLSLSFLLQNVFFDCFSYAVFVVR